VVVEEENGRVGQGSPFIRRAPAGTWGTGTALALLLAACSGVGSGAEGTGAGDLDGTDASPPPVGPGGGGGAGDDDDHDATGVGGPAASAATPGVPAGHPAGAPIRVQPRPYPPGVRFVDVTREWGIHHERRRDPEDGMPLVGAGVCVIDVDDRPPLDLFFTRPTDDGGSLLYVGSARGDYRDRTRTWGLEGAVGDALGCLALDLEGDGDQDLFAFGQGTVQLFEHRGDRFVDVTAARLETDPHGNALYTAAAAGDVDGDSDLDVAIVGYVDWDPEGLGRDTCYGGVPCRFDPPVYERVTNLLLIQEDDGRLVDFEHRARQTRLADGEVVVPECAVFGLPEGFPGCPGGLRDYFLEKASLAVGIADFDLDGVADIFIGNDFWDADQVFTRTGDGGRFQEVGGRMGLHVDYRGGGMDTMGWASGDVDGDGILDHARTNFEGYPSALHISRGQRDFFEDQAPFVGMLDREDTFRWAPAFVDHDLDGDLDLLEATGHYYREEHFEGRGYWGPEAQPTNLFDNDGTGRMVAIDPVPGDGLAQPTDSRSLNVADLDDDGRPEIILGNVEGPPSILKSVAPTDGHWLRIRLVGEGANREAALARVRVTAPGLRPGDLPRRHLRVKKLGEGYGGNDDPRLHVGIATAAPVQVEVVWPDGTRRVLEDVPVDREITIRR